jgi:putative sterol carrier protein
MKGDEVADQIDPTAVSPEQFAEMIANASDEDIESAIHTVGTEPTLDRVFQGFEERFQPDKAAGVQADVQFVIKDGGEEHPYLVSVNEGSCVTKRAQADDPKTTLTMDLVPFLKLVTGNAQGVQLFMTGKLKISGDLMFSQRLMTFFETPKASA